VTRVVALGVCLSLLTSACEADRVEVGEAGAEPDLGVVRTDPFRMTGAFEGESYLVTPCTDSEALIRLEPGPEVLDLVVLHADLVPRDMPVESIFVDLFGVAIQDGNDVTFEVQQVYRAGWEEWGCSWVPLEVPLRFAASGTEPEWTFHVGADSTATLARSDSSASGAVSALEGSLAAGWTLMGEVGGEAWTLELVEAPCRTPISGGFSHLSATLTWRGESLSGCGFIGDATDAL